LSCPATCAAVVPAVGHHDHPGHGLSALAIDYLAHGVPDGRGLPRIVVGSRLLERLLFAGRDNRAVKIEKLDVVTLLQPVQKREPLVLERRRGQLRTGTVLDLGDGLAVQRLVEPVDHPLCDPRPLDVRILDARVLDIHARALVHQHHQFPAQPVLDGE